MPVARSTRDKVAFQRTSESAHNQEDPESDEKTADEEMTSLVRSPVFLATNRRQQDTQDQEEPTPSSRLPRQGHAARPRLVLGQAPALVPPDAVARPAAASLLEVVP